MVYVLAVLALLTLGGLYFIWIELKYQRVSNREALDRLTQQVAGLVRLQEVRIQMLRQGQAGHRLGREALQQRIAERERRRQDAEATSHAPKP